MRTFIVRAIGAALGGAFFSALTEAAIPDATTVAAKWSRNAAAAQQDYVDGVQTTDKDPTALAITAIPYMRQRIIDAIDSGKVANGLRRVGKTGWQSATLAKAGNFATGVGAAETKVRDAFGPLLAYESTLQSRIDAMPNATLQDRVNRAVAWIQGMAQYQRPA